MMRKTSKANGLSIGENKLAIRVSKDGKHKDYTLSIERLSDDEPLLTMLRVDEEDIDIKDAPEVMWAQKTTKDVVHITYAYNTGVFQTTPPLSSTWDWALSLVENTLKLSVTNGSKSRNYTLKIIREEEVSLTFMTSPHVTSIEPNSFKVMRGDAVTSSTLKKIITMQFESDYEFDKFCIGAETGTPITNEMPFVATSNTNIYVLAKKKESELETPTLTMLTIDNVDIMVQDVMNAGTTSKKQLVLSFETNPADATLTLSPSLKDFDKMLKTAEWALSYGQNDLAIRVSKDGKHKDYTLSINRAGYGEPVLDELKIDGVNILLKAEPAIMRAPKTTKNAVYVSYLYSHGVITTTPHINNHDRWSLSLGENTLRFSLTNGDETRNYTLKITREIGLDYLNVDGIKIEKIEDVMNFGSTEKSAVRLLYTSIPEDCNFSFSPPLSANHEWNLQEGENSLTITLQKETFIKTYTLKLFRGKRPKLTSITIGGVRKDGDAIVEHSIIEFPVKIVFGKAVEYEVNVESDTPGATITYSPPLGEGNKIKFYADPYKRKTVHKKFSIKVHKDGRESLYRVDAMMMASVMYYAHDIAGKYPGTWRYMGKIDAMDDATSRDVLMQEKDIDITPFGDEVRLVFFSPYGEWRSILVNDEEGKGFTHYNKERSVAYATASMQAGQKTPVKVLISNSKWKNGKPTEPWRASMELNFNLKPRSEKIDAFVDKIYVNDEEITKERGNPEAFTRLFGSELAEIKVGKDKANIKVYFYHKVEKVKINDVEIKEDQLEEMGGGQFYIARVDDIDVGENTGKEVTIVATPKAEDLGTARETTMKFKLVR